MASSRQRARGRQREGELWSGTADFCREILRQVKAQTSLNAPVKIEVEGRSSDEITYQLYLMSQENLIEATIARYKTGSGLTCLPERLTWKGHEVPQSFPGRHDLAAGQGVGQGAGVEGRGHLTFQRPLAYLKAEFRERTGLNLLERRAGAPLTRSAGWR